MTELVEQPETPLETARRHVVEGEARCAQQTEILREMITDDPLEATNNHRAAAKAAQQVLATLEDTLDTMREHLRLEEERGLEEEERAAAGDAT